MSVLFVHNRAGYFGGVEQNIAATVAALRRRSVECHLAYSPQFESHPEYLRLFDATHLCTELNIVPSILPGATLAEIAKRTSAECVYLHKLDHLPESIDTIAVRKVQMVHDHDLCCPRRHKYFACNQRICKKPAGWRCYLDGAFLVRRPGSTFGIGYESIGAKLGEMRRYRSLDQFLVASDFMRQELVMNDFPEEKVTILPLAVDQTENSFSHSVGNPISVLFVGQLIRGKGVDLLLQALAKVQVPFRSAIVGKGNAEKSLRGLSERLGLNSRVEFAGWMDNAELPGMYARAQIVVVPSRWPEPFGMVGLEAMRHAKPVVAFNVGGIPDWLENGITGLLVPPADTDAMAGALEWLFTDAGLAREMGEAGRRRFEREFGFDRYISGLQRVLLPESAVSETQLCEAYA